MTSSESIWDFFENWHQVSSCFKTYVPSVASEEDCRPFKDSFYFGQQNFKDKRPNANKIDPNVYMGKFLGIL